MNKQAMLEIADLLDKVEPNKFHMSSWLGTLIRADEHYNYLDWEEFVNPDEMVPEHLTYHGMFLNEVVVSDKDYVDLTCNTTACIAGWVVANEIYKNNPQAKYLSSLGGSGFMNIEQFAKDILGLTSGEATRLFMCDEFSIWAYVYEEYGFTYEHDFTETWNIHPKHAADVIRRIALGELEL